MTKPGQIHVDSSVYDTWASVQDEEEPTIALLVRSDADPRAIAFRPEDLVSFGPGVLGGAKFVDSGVVPAGFALYLSMPGRFEAFVASLVGELEARGVVGRLEVFVEDRLDLPRDVDLVECRVRLAGSRVGRVWRATDAALVAASDLGASWVGSAGRQAFLQAGAGISTPLAAGDYGLVGVNALHQRYGGVYIRSGDGERFRSFACTPSSGAASYITGGSEFASTWEADVREMIGLLRSIAGHAVYGYVKRGRDRSAAEYFWPLLSDWVPRPFLRTPYRGELTEATWASDAFGIQLLGDGFSGRLVAPGGWRLEPAPSGSTLIADDLAAWFAHDRPSDATIESGRRDLQPVLVTQSVVDQLADDAPPGG